MGARAGGALAGADQYRTGGEELYRQAIERLGSCRMAIHLARAHLVYGEWLRRGGRRRDAREQLGTAHELPSGMGLEALAERAARELQAVGEQPRKRAAQLFLSPRTIDAHLRSIFGKLGIASRRQLRNLHLP
ncbi:LuxR C-terminal-related transcriptional regulator [Nonomuraea rubra]|uniref:LuxR C-terminal-related transcriptional regulator n=1 Tax=Nonomuraea rubra TaxID=46180 RepID=UPI0033CD76D2